MSNIVIYDTYNVNVTIENDEVVGVQVVAGFIHDVIAGTNITIDKTDPLNPIISSTGGGSSYTFSNGLTESGGTVKLGGTLIENTTINTDGFDFNLSGVVDGGVNGSWYFDAVNINGYNSGTQLSFNQGTSVSDGYVSLLANNYYNGFLAGYDGSKRGFGIYTGTAAANERLFINENGSWSVDSSTGTSGYVLTSNGSGSSPTWQAASGGGGLTVGTTTITGGTNGYGFYNNSGVLGEFAYGTGVRTFLTTPSWTNFQSAITGTSPYLPLTGATYTTTTGDGLALTTSTLTSGNLVSLTSTSTAAASSTQTVLNIATSGANGTSGQYTYAAKISNTHTGTSSRNYGLQIVVSGGTENYALDVYGSGRFNGSGSEAIYLNSSASSTAFIDMASSGTRRNRLLWTSTSPGYFETAGIGIGGVGTSGAGLSVAGGIVLQGADRYLNFTSTHGSSGYGIRDNGGTMEFKNSGGSWTPL